MKNDRGYYRMRKIFRGVRRLCNYFFLSTYRFRNISPDTKLSRRAKISGASNISIGNHTIIHANAILQCTDWRSIKPAAGSIEIGENCVIQPYAYLHTCGGKIIIGDYCSINPYTILYGHGGLTIGNYVRIAANTVIIPANHVIDDLASPISRQGSTMLGINIQDDVWIASGVTILDGVEIATGCVIAAGSVVTKSTEPFGVYAGVPAARMRDRGDSARHQS